MCAPVIPLLGAIGGIATAASQLGLIGRRNQQSAPTFKPTAAPQIKGAGPAAQGAGDDEKTKKVDESIKIQQNAKQKRDKQTTKKGLAGLGAEAAVNTGISPTTSPSGTPNIGT